MGKFRKLEGKSEDLVLPPIRLNDLRPAPRITPNYRPQAAIIALVVFIPIMLTGLQMWKTAYLERDVQGVVSHVANGWVVGIGFVTSSKGNVRPTATVTLQADGMLMDYQTVLLTYGRSTPMHTGDAIVVTYRVGKSGRLYVDHVAPRAGIGR